MTILRGGEESTNKRENRGGGVFIFWLISFE